MSTPELLRTHAQDMRIDHRLEPYAVNCEKAAAELEKCETDCRELKCFIKWITLELQQHRDRTDAQKDAWFQKAYALYRKHNLDNLYPRDFMTDLYRRASIQAQRNRNQFEQAQRSYDRFCRRERRIALAMYLVLLAGMAAVLAAAVQAFL